MSTSKWSLHAPRFGAGLSGGQWSVIKDILFDVFRNTELDITIYDLDSIRKQNES